MNSKRIVITGGPGTGKTSLINTLAARGFSHMPEVSRDVTRAAREKGIEQLFLHDPIRFSQALLEARIQQHKAGEAHLGRPLFYDRGVPDVIAYLDYLGTAFDPGFEQACFEHRYDAVFILPPWMDIFEQDDERYETFQEAQRIHEFLLRRYQKVGYQPLSVPEGSLSYRLDFILNAI